MAPNSRIIITRHSQSEQNVHLDYSVVDPPLTALGREQAASLVRKIPQLQDEVDLIVTSPMRRTLQSTTLGWKPAIERLGGLKTVICLPQLQECADWICDTGSDRVLLETDPELADFDFSLLTPDWNSKEGFYAPDPGATAARAAWVRRWLRGRPEKMIVVMAHGDIIRELTGSAEGPSKLMWSNAEARIYTLDPALLTTDECFFLQDYVLAAAGEHNPTQVEIQRLAERREAHIRGIHASATAKHA